MFLFNINLNHLIWPQGLHHISAGSIKLKTVALCIYVLHVRDTTCLSYVDQFLNNEEPSPPHGSTFVMSKTCLSKITTAMLLQGLGSSDRKCFNQLL